MTYLDHTSGGQWTQGRDPEAVVVAGQQGLAVVAITAGHQGWRGTRAVPVFVVRSEVWREGAP